MTDDWRMFQHHDAPMADGIGVGVCDDPDCKLYHLVVYDKDKKALAQLLVSDKWFYDFIRTKNRVNFNEKKTQMTSRQ